MRQVRTDFHGRRQGGSRLTGTRPVRLNVVTPPHCQMRPSGINGWDTKQKQLSWEAPA